MTGSATPKRSASIVRGRSKAVPGDLIGIESHCPQRRVYGSITHRPIVVPFAPERERAPTGQLLKVTEHRDGLMRERNDVRLAVQLARFLAFHARRRDRPNSSIEVELIPSGMPKLTGAQEHHRQQSKRCTHHVRSLVAIARSQ